MLTTIMLSATTTSNYSAETFLQLLNGAAHHSITYYSDGIESLRVVWFYALAHHVL